MKQAEIERLLLLFRAGDESAGQAIVEGNMRFVTYIVLNQFAWAWNRPSAILSADDLIQEGVFGLYDALRGYDPARARFTTHAWQWVRNSIQKALQVEIPREIELISLEEPFENASALEADEVPELAQFFHDPQNVAHEVETSLSARKLRFDVETALGKLPPADAKILRLRFGIGADALTCREIGERLGWSRHRVHAHEKRAKARLLLICIAEHGRYNPIRET